MQIGDKVVYILPDAPELGLINGITHTVKDTCLCNCEDDPLMIDIGSFNPNMIVMCCDCGKMISDDGQLFFHNSWFRKLDDLTTADELIEQAITVKQFESGGCGPSTYPLKWKVPGEPEVEIIGPEPIINPRR